MYETTDEKGSMYMEVTGNQMDIKFVQEEGIIWVQKVEDPSSFGVVKLDENNVITDFVENPGIREKNLV